MSNNYYTPPTDLAALTRARSADINLRDDSVDAAFDKVPDEAKLKRGTVNYAVTGGSANAYTVTLSYVPSGYVDGLLVNAYIHANNTGAATVNVNSLGVKSIKLQNGDTPLAGDLQKFADLRYSTTTGFFHVQGNSSVSAAAAAASAVAAAASAAAADADAASAAASATAAQTSGSAIALAALLAASGGSALVGNGGETVATSFESLQLSNYTALRAYSGSRKSIYVTDYLVTAVQMGTAGLFVRVNGDASTADNAGTVIVASNGVRWKRVFDGAVNPEWFGAKHDGVTDDTTAMQAAIDTAHVVTPPKGNYILSTITLNSRAPIIAEGRSQVTFTSKSGSGAAAMVTLPVGPTIYSGIRGVSFVGAGAANAGQHCWYFNAQASLSSPFDGGIWYSTFESCTISGFDGHCIWLRAGHTAFLLPIQFNTFNKIYALRPSNSTSRCLLMTGQVQSNTFGNECQFDGVAKGTGTNIEISREFLNGATYGGASVGGSAVGDNPPGPNTFDEIISQNCSLAILVDRAYNNRFNGPYFEACDKVYDQATSAHGNVIEEPNIQNSGYDGAGGGFYFRNGSSSSMLVIGGTYSTATLDRFAIDTSSNHGFRYEGVPKFLNSDVVLAAGRSDGYTTGLTSQISVSVAGALNLFTGNPGSTTYLVNTSATTVIDIYALVMPGAQLFLKSTSGTVTYGTGGNLVLGAAASVAVGSGSVAHFVRFDLGTNWVLVSVTP